MKTTKLNRTLTALVAVAMLTATAFAETTVESADTTSRTRPTVARGEFEKGEKAARDGSNFTKGERTSERDGSNFEKAARDGSNFEKKEFAKDGSNFVKGERTAQRDGTNFEKAARDGSNFEKKSKTGAVSE